MSAANDYPRCEDHYLPLDERGDCRECLDDAHEAEIMARTDLLP